MTYRSARCRAGALALALALSASLPLVAQAAPAAPNFHAGSAGILTHTTLRAPFQAATLPRALAARVLRPLARSAAPSQAVTDPTNLAFTPPSNAIQPQASAVDTTFANDPTKNIFAALNNGKYDTAGMQSGYTELFSLPIGTGSDTVDIAYLATIYGSAAQATARVTATQQYLTSKGLTGQSCGTNCYLYALTFQDNNGRTIALTYALWSNDNVVAELGFLVYGDVLTANQDAFLSDFKAVVGLAGTVVPIQQAASTLAIADFEVLRVANGKATVVHKLKSGQAGVFAADLQVPSPSDQIQAQVTFKVGKKTVGPLLLGNAQTVSDGTVLVSASHKFKVKKTTTVVAHLQVQDGSAQATKDLTFKVTK